MPAPHRPRMPATFYPDQSGQPSIATDDIPAFQSRRNETKAEHNNVARNFILAGCNQPFVSVFIAPIHIVTLFTSLHLSFLSSFSSFLFATIITGLPNSSILIVLQ